MKYYTKILLILCCFFSSKLFAQTMTDGLMMAKQQFCLGASYRSDFWKNYWESDFKRENLNLGNVSLQELGIMGNYGIKNNLNVIFSLPYVWTKASAGTLQGMNGLQDLSLAVKYRFYDKNILSGKFSLIAVAGISSPTTNYVADYLPLAIGSQSKTASLRGIAYYRHQNGLFLTLQGGYIRRANITIDRYSYYTDRQYNTNEVFMPDVAHFTVQTGLYKPNWIAELTFEQMNTLGGADIRKNDMPFPSTRMVASKLGAMFTYRIPKHRNLSIIASYNYTISGRNVGQSNNFGLSVFYVLPLHKGECQLGQ
ncbi:MAG: transporter [Bacteroidetes bacterium]|nr:MAG: transporter [Bacteroidota bacterium]